MNKSQSSACNFKLKPVVASVVMAMSTLASNGVHAGSGWGAGYYVTNPAVPTPVATFYANSPAGAVVALDPVTGLPVIDPTSNLPVKVDSGKALRKFVDTLPGMPGLNASGFLSAKNDLGLLIPVAVPEAWTDAQRNTNADYYEIAAIEFTQQLHADLPKATRLRGYVQLSTTNNPGQHIALTYPDGSPILDVNRVQVYAHDLPSHLGPIIPATSGRAARIKFTNYLPYTDNLGVSHGAVNGTGDAAFLPVDHTIAGAGTAPPVTTLTGTTTPSFTENRAEMHLVGGQAPWISGGAPHQWVAPAGETGAYAMGLGKGVANQNLPDMPNPGAGSTTLYFPNAESARMLFVQDRTSGMTRVNTYAGLESAYFLTDAIDQALMGGPAVANSTLQAAIGGALPADQIPLILEDKTFVPANVAQQDAKWDTGNWGAVGDLWFPHVYETNQATDPTNVGASTVDGINPVGRWDYGPWFWPIFPTSGPLPSGEHGNASFTPEAYMDTPLVNGVAYPTLTVDPKAYRIRILNASNDRFFNLGWYLADTTVKAPQLDRNGNPTFDAAGNQLFFINTEVPMVPAVADTTGAPLVPVSSVLPYDPNCLCQYPLMQQLQPTIAFSGPTRAWPIDSRPGGAPDPTAVGPDFIAIGTDGGFLPTPVDIPSQPVTYESNRRSVTVTNVYGYGMLVGPSERADTVVDFAAYAGKTLILYNDAPAPFPFNDQRNDYFTNDADQTASGGTYSTQPGYGPNTRTVMQVVVNTTLPGGVTPTPFNVAKLGTALPAAYAASQPTPIVPQVAYNQAFGTNDTDTFAHVASGSVAQPTLNFTYSSTQTMTVQSLSLISSGGQLVVGTTNIVGNATPGSGTGYLTAPAVTFNNGTCLVSGGTSAAATATVQNTAPAGSLQPSYQVVGLTLTNPGSGYICAPQITFGSVTGVDPVTGAVVSGSGAQATAVMQVGTKAVSQSILVQTKSEQELFDTLGRYNSTGGVELPLTSDTTQTTIPLNYIDAPTEFLCDSATSPLAALCLNNLSASGVGGQPMTTQIWKIVDNGFWSNTIHLSGFDVQLVNRVGWDGTVKAPASNEVGWKDTFRLNPLEDVVLAVRPKAAAVPFGMVHSSRNLDPSVALNASGSNLGFTADPGVLAPDNVTPLLTATANMVQNYGDEFYWGSALQGHSEDDFLRPIVFSRTEVAPGAATITAVTAGTTGTTLTWTDAIPTSSPTKLGNPANEIGVTVNRIVFNGPAKGTETTGYAQLLANAISYVDPTPPVGYDYAYTVTAWNNAGATESAVSPVIHILAAPKLSTPTGTHAIGSRGSVSVTWSNAVTGVKPANYVVKRAVSTAPTVFNAVSGTITQNGAAFSFTDSTAIVGVSYLYELLYTAPGTTTAVTSPASAVIKAN